MEKPLQDSPSTRTFRVEPAGTRERLDRAVARRLAEIPGVSRTRLQGWIDEGRVRVNGAPAPRAALRLAAGDEVEVLLPARARHPPPPAQPIPLAVLFEDEHYLAVDKPPGMIAHPSPARREGTLLNALLWRAREWGEGAAPHLVSRLDRDTSGVLLVAKSGAAHAAAAAAMVAGRAEKEYLAVVYGPAPAAKGCIDAGILRDPADPRRRTVSATGGRRAVTLWERLAEGETSGPGSSGTVLALLRCRLRTGRTHQIRVHLRSRGMPIVGDPLYGEPRWKGLADPALAATCREFPRQALHARRLALPHPITRQPLDLAAPVPPDLEALLAAAGLTGG
jgi:23S rRNA pseudouridine1911/1915/1917 synthase